MNVSEVMLNTDIEVDQPALVRSSRHVTTITVEIPGKQPHDILVGIGVLDELPKRIAALRLARDILIVSSRTVFGLYGNQLVATLHKGGCDRIAHETFPDGEQYKTVETWQALIAKVHSVEEEFGTKVLIVTLGGGVVGDVGGFVAACYDRGRDYIQLPTTLLGDVDCAVGGKTGVNFQGKNLIGQFHQPRLVFAELNFLRSLPVRELRSGLAEVIKYGVILDPQLFAYLEGNARKVLTCDLGVIEHLAIKSFTHKVRLVEEDERDVLGVRAKLNFGHTIGHALEAATDYSQYVHGEAIAIGMVCACDLAERLGMVERTLTQRVEALCKEVGLPTVIVGADLDSIMRFMQHDKKFIAGKNRFVLPTSIGQVVLKEGIPETLIRWVIHNRMRRS